MGNIKTKHVSGDSAKMPTVKGKSGHPEQKPGNASARPDAKMSWSGSKK